MLVRLHAALSVGCSGFGLSLLISCILLYGYTFAAEEIPEVSEVPEVSGNSMSRYVQQLRHVVSAFEGVTDKRQITYLADLLCQRYLVLTFFISMPEDMTEFKRLKHHTILLGELTARLNRRSIEALDIFDTCSDSWGECSYRTFLPAIASRMGLFELISWLVKEFERFTLEDLPFVFSLSERKNARCSHRYALEKKAEQWRRALHELKNCTWCCFDLDNTLALCKDCVDTLLFYSSIANIHLSKIADKRYKDIERRINRFKDKADEAFKMSASYGGILAYVEFKKKLAQAFFSSVLNAQLYRFFHAYLYNKIDRVAKPIFTLHHLTILVAIDKNPHDRELLWHALKHVALVGDHFAYYDGVLHAWPNYSNRRIAALDILIQKLRAQLEGADESKQKELVHLLTRSLEQREKLANTEASNRFLRDSFVARPMYIEGPSVSNRYREELDSYLAYMKDETGLQTVQEVLGRQEHGRRQTFFNGSEVVADFCSAGYRTTLAKYIQLFFDYYFGKTPWLIKDIGEEVLKKIVVRYTEHRNSSDLLNHLSIVYLDTEVPAWVEPSYNLTVLEYIRNLLQSMSEELCQPKQQEDLQKLLVPGVEDHNEQELISSPPKGNPLFGKKMGWQELLSKLEEIERLYIPRVSIQEWSKDAGYAHCWRSQKSSLCVTYFFFKEARQQRQRKRDISLNMSRLSKQTDRQDTEWDFYHAFPLELDHTLLNEYSVRIDQNDERWVQLGLKRDVRNSYAYIVRAKIVPGYTDPIRLQDPDFKASDFGHTGYFVWLCRGNDICYHRQFHPSTPRL